jgi:tRNA G18 (ribose-2'-O)-methylase SpoU
MEINDSRVLFNNGKVEPLASPPIVVADLIRTPENLGNLIRLAANIGIRKVVSVERVPLKESKIRKTACMAWDYVELVHVMEEELFDILPSDYTLVAVETSAQSVNLYTTSLPEKSIFVLGNEVHGIRQELLDRCPCHVHIPMTGPATSMNVSHAASVVLFEWVRQWLVG